MIFCDTHKLVPSPIIIREGSLKQLIEADAETQSQTLGAAQGTLWMWEMRIIGAQGVKDATRKLRINL